MTRAVRRRWIALAAFVFLCLLAVSLFGSLNSRLVGGFAAHLHAILTLPLFLLGKTPVTLTFVVKVILFLFGLGTIAHLALRFLQRRILTHTPLQASQQFAIARVVSYLVFAFGVAIGLESIGLNLNSLVVVGGALGLGVGLGLQNAVANFVAGLILLFEQPIRIGDRIEIGGTTGDVIDIRARCTWVRTNDDIIYIVPNSDFITKTVTNWTVNDRQVRIAIPVGVGYSSEPEHVRDILLGVARENPDVLKSPEPSVILEGFGDNSIDFVLRVWTTGKVQFPAVLRSDLNFAIFSAFMRAGIELPNPQRDLHLRSIDRDAIRSLRELNRKQVSGF